MEIETVTAGEVKDVATLDAEEMKRAKVAEESGRTEARTFVVIKGYYWGKGRTIAEAMKKCHKAGGMSKRDPHTRCWAFTADPDEVIVLEGVGLQFMAPKHTKSIAFYLYR